MKRYIDFNDESKLKSTSAIESMRQRKPRPSNSEENTAVSQQLVENKKRK